MLPVLSEDKARANIVAYTNAAKGAYAVNTDKARASDWRAFDTWCEGRGVVSLPATAETVAAFIDAMADTRAPATIRRYVSTVSTAHKAAGVTPNPCASEYTKLALRRLASNKGVRQQQATGFTWAHIDKALRVLGNKPRDLFDKALVATGYDTMARRSELSALRFEDMAVASDGGATVLIRRSKTDQKGEGSIRYLAPATVEHIQAWVKYAGITEGPLFRSMNVHGHVSDAQVSDKGVVRAYKRVAYSVGLDIATISGHSCRVGAAQDMVGANIDLAAIMQAGGWKTPAMPARYSERVAARRSGMAKLAAIQGR